jgi:hypothetical protein
VKRFVAVVTLAAAASMAGLVGSSAQAASVCIDYDININGQGQAGSQCLPG